MTSLQATCVVGNYAGKWHNLSVTRIKSCWIGCWDFPLENEKENLELDQHQIGLLTRWYYFPLVHFYIVSLTEATRQTFTTKFNE